MLSGGSLRLFRISGIEVRVHVSWLVIFALITWSLGDQYYPQLVPGISTEGALLLGAISAILLFVSVLIHELAHSLVARSRGVGAHSITLFIFGGVSTLSTDAPKASTEFVIAIVGPLTSFVLAGLAYVVAAAVTEVRTAAVFSYVALINILLGAFNLIPGFPLDGGRVLRAIVWRATNSRRRGLEVAVALGQIVGYGFIIWGVLRVFSADVLGGIWIAAIGWFLQSAGASNLQSVRLEEGLRGVKVRDVLRPDTTAVTPDTTVADLIEDYLLPGNRRAVPAVSDGRLVGIVSLSDLRSVASSERATTPVSSVMGGRDGLITVRPDDPLTRALTAMLGGDYEQLPVVEQDRLVGMLTRADIVRQLELREALSPRAGG
ncbi:MAG TPA: site-2 protease family protein [Candidatus Eisenbacteria bacterium]|nr:site-2 protease family protein [Candidatus Eisenbacteria bacterium]